MIPLFEHTSYAVERRRARRRDAARFLLWLVSGAAASFLFVHVADKALGQAAYDAANHAITSAEGSASSSSQPEPGGSALVPGIFPPAYLPHLPPRGVLTGRAYE